MFRRYATSCVNINLLNPVLIADGSVVSMLGGGELIGTPTTLIFNPRGELVAKQPGRVSNQVIEDYIAKSAVAATSVR